MAAVDVFEEEPPKNSPLLTFDCVIGTPHLGASTEEAQVNVSVDIAVQVRDALLGRGIRNAVNFPSLDPETHKVLEPYIRLAEKIGSFQGQMADGPVRQIRITYAGDVASYQTSPITIATVKGLLTPTLGETVNYVNASVIAKERGIRIIESKAEEIDQFVNAIRLEVTTDKGVSQIVGGLFAQGEPRIVRINEFAVDAIPSGYMLLTSNIDRPGMIGQLGTILGKNKINIAGMTFGREAPGKRAVMLLNVDQPIPPKVQEEIRRSPNVRDVRVIKL
jgi:D-3-phosphoglycerate dehydrogenase